MLKKSYVQRKPEARSRQPEAAALLLASGFWLLASFFFVFPHVTYSPIYAAAASFTRSRLSHTPRSISTKNFQSALCFSFSIRISSLLLPESGRTCPPSSLTRTSASGNDIPNEGQ